MPRGGARPGAGKPKGIPTGPQKATITKAFERELLSKAILKHKDRMLRSQVMAAIGIGHLYVRDKTGKFSRITDQDRIDHLLATGTERVDYFIFSKDPSTAAWTDLMNRALDKPKEQVQEIEVSGDEALIAALNAGRLRAKKAKGE